MLFLKLSVSGGNMVKHSERRRHRIIEPTVQVAVVGRLLMYAILFMVASSTATLVRVYSSAPNASPSAFVARFWHDAGPFIVTFLALSPVFVWDSIKLTNRLVGPIVRIRDLLRRTNAGQASYITMKYRKTDFWCDLANEMNLLIDRAGRSSLPAGARGTSGSEGEMDAAVT
jgi:hypothetical protein